MCRDLDRSRRSEWGDKERRGGDANQPERGVSGPWLSVRRSRCRVLHIARAVNRNHCPAVRVVLSLPPPKKLCEYPAFIYLGHYLVPSVSNCWLIVSRRTAQKITGDLGWFFGFFGLTWRWLDFGGDPDLQLIPDRI